jgi:hypothetical protein
VAEHLAAVLPDVLAHYTMPGRESLVSHLFAAGLEHGFDLAGTQEFEVDQSILVALHFLTPRMQMPIVPIFFNGIVHPLPADETLPGAGRDSAPGDRILSWQCARRGRLQRQLFTRRNRSAVSARDVPRRAGSRVGTHHPGVLCAKPEKTTC